MFREVKERRGIGGGKENCEINIFGCFFGGNVFIFFF